MSKVDWSLAPEGATHKIPTGCWYKIDGYQVYCWSNAGNWAGPYSIRQYQDGSIDDMVKRPKPATWSGPQDGLPPVNTPCDYMWNYKREGSEYVKARVLHHDGGSVIVRILEGEGKGSLKESRGGDCGGHSIFRAIKTPDQLAAEQRETAIREIMDIADVDCRVTAARLVDAGFKREVV